MSPPAGKTPTSVGGRAPRKYPPRKSIFWAGVSKYMKTSPQASFGARYCDDSDERLLKTGEYSDATIRCDQLEIKVHKSVVCGRSVYFQKSFAGYYEETNTALMCFPDEHKAIIFRILQFIYFGRYSLSSPSGTDEGRTDFDHWIFSSVYKDVEDEFNDQDKELHIKMFAAGDKYRLEELQVYAYQNALHLLLLPREVFYVDESKLAEKTILEITAASELIFATSPDLGLRDIAVCLIKVAISKNGFACKPLQTLVSETKDISDAVALSHLKLHSCKSCGKHAVYLAKLCADRDCSAWDCIACKPKWARICCICFTPWDMESMQHEMVDEGQEEEEGVEEDGESDA